MLSKAHIDSQKAHGRQLNAKVCDIESVIFVILSCFLSSLFNNTNSRLVRVLTVVFARNCLLSQGTDPWPISVFITINFFWSMKLFVTLPTAVHFIGHHFLMLYTYARIVSFPNQRRIIGLRARVVPTWNRKLTNLAASVRLAQSLPIVVAKAYAIGKALHLAAYL